MHARQRTEITIETDQIFIIRRWRSSRFWCPECGREVDVVGRAEAEALIGTIQPMLGNSAEDRGWHVVESEDKTLLICLESLRKSL